MLCNIELYSNVGKGDETLSWDIFTFCSVHVINNDQYVAVG